MPFFTYNIGEKIEMNGFKTEDEARAYCRKAHYPIFLLFEGEFMDGLDYKVTTPIAIYVHGKGFNAAPVEKDVPYQTYRVLPDKLPQSPDFAAITVEDKTYAEVHDAIDDAVANGKRLIWVIYEDSRMIEVIYASNPQTRDWLRERDTLSGGEVVPDYSLLVVELFEEITAE